MFSRAAKSVVNNFGQRNCLTSSIKNTRALVLAAERSRIPGILNPLVEQTVEKPVSTHVRRSEQNGSVAFPLKRNETVITQSKHDATRDDRTFTSRTGGEETQKTANSCESNLPNSSELSKSEAGEFLDSLPNIEARAEAINESKKHLRTFPASHFSHDVGISKQKTETWRSKTKSVQILGEMGPSTDSRSCYSRTEFEAWLPELLEHCQVSGIKTTGFRGLFTDYSPPSVLPKNEKIKTKSRRKTKLNSRKRESKSAKDTAVGERGAQICSAIVHHGSVLNQSSRKRRRRAKRAGDKTRHNHCVPTENVKSCHYLPERRKLKTTKIRARKDSKVNYRSGCNKKSEKRFLQKCNTARENLTVPAVFSKRKPILLHNFDNGEKKPKSKFSAKNPNASASSRRTSTTVKNWVTKSRPQGQTVPVRSIRSTHEKSCNLNPKRKSKRIRSFSITAKLIPTLKSTALRKSTSCLPVYVSESVDNIDSKNFGLDESSSRSVIHESQSSETRSSVIQKCSAKICSSALSTAMSRIMRNEEGTYRSDSTETSCASLVYNDAALFPKSFECAERCSEDASPQAVQKLETSTSSPKIKQLEVKNSVTISSTSLLTTSLLSSNNLHGGVEDIEYASGEPKNFEENLKQKKLKKFLGVIGKLQIRNSSRTSISKKKKKKKKKCSGLKITEANDKRDNHSPKF